MSLAPNPENYLLGRGRVYFSQEDENQAALGFLDLGNCPAFTVTISADTLDHYSSRSGLKTRDARVITQMNCTFGVTLDEFSKENLQLAFMATFENVTQTGNTWTDENVGGAKLDRYVDMGKRYVTVTGVKKSPATSLTVDTDYVIDATRGWIKILSTNDKGVVDDDTLLVTGSYATCTIPTLTAAAQEEGITGHLVFVGDPAEGQAFEFHAWRCNLKPSGDIGLISEEWATFQLEGEVLKDETNHPDEPYFVIYEIS